MPAAGSRRINLPWVGRRHLMGALTTLFTMSYDNLCSAGTFSVHDDEAVITTD